MNIRKTITSEIEWNTIKKAQADGKLQELLQWEMSWTSR